MVYEPNHLLSTTATALQESIQYHARYSLGQSWEHLSKHQLFTAVVLAVRDRIVDRMLATESRYQAADAKCLYYLSMEFLMGQSLSNNLYNLGILEECRQALARMDLDLEADLGIDSIKRIEILGNYQKSFDFTADEDIEAIME